MGRLLGGLLRRSDLACRYGGEEFAMVFPDTSIQSARVVCERYREKVAEQCFEHEGVQFHITVSIGLASVSAGQAISFEDLTALADRALYRAKEAGRDQVVACTTAL